jgi:hypothetical protein
MRRIKSLALLSSCPFCIAAWIWPPNLMVHPDLGTLGCRSERGRRSDWPDQTLVRANAAVRLKFGLRN